MRFFSQQGHGFQDHAWRALAALKGLFGKKGLLDGVKMIAFG
jgi:hypothetical protein